MTCSRHLLGKKSWNVYNTANIEKVKADEAKAAAREVAEDQRLQEVDAQRRLQILRGEDVESAPVQDEKQVEIQSVSDSRPSRDRKRKRIAGENDTDREIRFAQEEQAMLPVQAKMQKTSKKSSDAPLTDSQGHINLFPQKNPSVRETKNAEAEQEKAKKKKEYEDQYTMRFSNAAGFKQSIDQQPWYEKAGASEESTENAGTQSKDVWGNEDPRRRERQKMRAAADDPLLAMRSGAATVRQVEKERLRWREHKIQEIKELDEDERRRERRRKHRHHGDHSRRKDPDHLLKSSKPLSELDRKSDHRSHHSHRKHSRKRHND